MDIVGQLFKNDADPNVSEQQTFLVVVAIDFGTTSSGYAYSFTKEPECIHVMRRWEGGDPGVSNQKTPTTILLTPERKFHSFGYAARDFYHDLDPNEAKQWLYLEKFKMKLHTTGDLTMDTDLTAANGKKVKALEIFAYALQYFKEQALKELSDQAGSEFENSDVRWVITVPAIWKQPAKQFMRQAAYQALGPAVLTSHVGTAWPADGTRQQECASPPSHRALGTTLLCPPQPPPILSFAGEARAGLASPENSEQLIIALEPEAASIYCRKLRLHQMTDLSSKAAVNGVDFVKWSSQGMLRMSPDAMNALFKPTIDSIIEHLRDLFQKPEVSTVKFLFLVGGFAEAPLLQQAVQAAFGDKCRVIIPQDVGLTILKGAVLFGLDPAVIKVRRSPLTYGVGVLNRYVEGKHPPEKLLVKDGTRWCTDVFDKFISADQSVALGELVKRSYTPAKPSQLVIVINIYSSELDDVSFITDPGVKKCGTLRLDLTGASSANVPARREIQTLMQFGDTEIKATAVDIATSKSVKVGIDFLNY
ncbi:hypothetical protein Celaphus_00008720 [Cervus elaphus hippelaphus]|uniref:HSPA12A n=1 Tax=Cervus elaphus hippelaphus TaxID=46360 RepID=A0A212CNM3_CEREH|nr:hypothetical protein Celaphus_00008720 [Cervus elaphus hippelaphus]